MSEGMVERVAMAIHERFTGGYRGDWSEQSDANKREWRETARAAIEAMREPTEGMLSAGEDTNTGGGLGDSGGFEPDEFKPEIVYRAMINAALHEGRPQEGGLG